MEKTLFDKITYYLISILIILYFSLTNLISHSGSVFIGLMIFFLLLVLIKDKKMPEFNEYEKKYFIIICCYLGIHVFSLLYNGAYLGKFEARLSRIDQELRLLLILPLAFLFDYKKIKEDYFWWGVSIGAIFCFIYSFSQVLDGAVRARGSYHAISFGDLSLIMGYLSFMGLEYFKKKNIFFLLIPVIAVLGGLAAVTLSGTRGAFVSLPFFVSIIIIKNRKSPFVYLLIITLVLTFYAADKKTNNYLSNRFKSTFKTIETMAQTWEKGGYVDVARFEIWKAGYYVVKDNPVFGIGQKGFNKKVKKLVRDKKVSPSIAVHGDPHNQLLYDTIACGFAGFIAGFIFFLYPCIIFLKRIKENPDIAYTGLVLVLSFFSFGLTETILARNIYITFIVIGLSFLLYLLKNENSEKNV